MAHRIINFASIESYKLFRHIEMIEIKSLSDVSYYANFEVYHYGETDIIIYDDHRCILTVLFEAKKLGLIDAYTNLITFDLHDDARPLMPETVEALKELMTIDLDKISSRDFKSFVEFDVSEYDDDWVKVGMELGLINNVINIGCEENFNISDWKNNLYWGNDGNEHSGFVLGHLKDALNRHGGQIADSAIHTNDRIRKILNYDAGTPYPSINDNTNFVLDFDLDCFTTSCMEKRFAWPEGIFIKEYGRDSIANYFMKQLIRKSKFITICREPSYCGGIGEANKILSYLDKYLFDGCLGTTSIK